MTVVPPESKDPNKVLIGIAPLLDVGHPVVADTIATSQQSEAPTIPRGATITLVDGVEVSSFLDIARELSRHRGERITIDWRIDDQNAGDAVVDVGEDEKIVAVQATPRQIIPLSPQEPHTRPGDER